LCRIDRVWIAKDEEYIGPDAEVTEEEVYASPATKAFIALATEVMDGAELSTHYNQYHTVEVIG